MAGKSKSDLQTEKRANASALSFLYPFFLLVLAALLLFSLTACGGGSSSGGGGTSGQGSEASQQDPERPDTKYEIPPYREAVFDESAVIGNGEVLLDISHLSEGYFGVWSDSDARLKLQVIKGEKTFTYDLVPQKIDFFPMQDGNGYYEIRVMKNIESNKYFTLYSCGVDVALESEFVPYLCANQYADYTRDSECVKLATQMAENATDVHDFIAQVYKHVTQKVKYDYPKAEEVPSGYIPVPDETLKTGKGICIDYAALTASMLRSQGVPTKIIFGYVAPNDVYHAWNMFYTEDEGWITVEFKVDPSTWTRLDLTFSANGSDAQFIGDGSNYSDVYQF